MASYSRLESYENVWGNIKRYLGVRAYKDIESFKEDILDQWNNLDESYWIYLTELIIEEWTHEF